MMYVSISILIIAVKHLEKLYSSTKGEMKLSQTAFQELMGRIEVLGELLLENNE